MENPWAAMAATTGMDPQQVPLQAAFAMHQQAAQHAAIQHMQQAAVQQAAHQAALQQQATFGPNACGSVAVAWVAHLPATVPSVLSELERFIVDNKLDDVAAQNLRAEAPQIQRLVMDRGSLAECLNPSSAVIGRIRDAKLQVKYGASPDACRGGRTGLGPGGPLTGGSNDPLGYSTLQQQALQSDSQQQGYRAVAGDEVEAFIRMNRLDETAARNLRAEPPRVQAAVLDRGSLAECMNPSSALIGRIRDAKLQIKYGGGPLASAGGRAPAGTAARFAPDGSMADGSQVRGCAGADLRVQPELVTPELLERFIMDNRLDDMATRNLRAEPCMVQAAVISRGSLAECLNPSSALIGRIRDAKLQVKYGTSGNSLGRGGGSADSQPGSPATASRVDDFIADNLLDDGAARALRAEPSHVQEEVMTRGSLLACTNPSSAVMGRIREARMQRGGGGGALAGMDGGLNLDRPLGTHRRLGSRATPY